jgi:translation initiation factor IF-3
VEDALRLAQDADLDLVEVAPEARPPVCKIMDYGKFKYEADMKAREARRNQSNTVLKEIRFRLKIDPHDYGTKKGHVERFLKAGDKVKVMIMFRGREQSRPEMGIRLLQRLAGDVDELGFIESSPKQDGRNMIMVLGPVKKKAEQKSEQRRASLAPTPIDFDPDLSPQHAVGPTAPAAEIVAETEPAEEPAVESAEAATPAAIVPAPAAVVPRPSAAPLPSATPRPAVAPRQSGAVRPSAARPAPTGRPAVARSTSAPRPTTAPRPAAAPVDSASVETKPVETKPVETNAAEPRPVDAKPAAARPAAMPKPVPRPAPAAAKPMAKPSSAGRTATSVPSEEAKA